VPRPQLDQFAARRQPLQRGFEICPAFALDAQLARQLLEIAPGVRQTPDVLE
jgi:hypothetical protein